MCIPGMFARDISMPTATFIGGGLPIKVYRIGRRARRPTCGGRMSGQCIFSGMINVYDILADDFKYKKEIINFFVVSVILI